LKTGGKIPAETASLSIDDGFRGSGRLGGGGCSRAKLVSEGQNKGIREKYRAKRKKGRKK